MEALRHCPRRSRSPWRPVRREPARPRATPPMDRRPSRGSPGLRIPGQQPSATADVEHTEAARLDTERLDHRPAQIREATRVDPLRRVYRDVPGSHQPAARRSYMALSTGMPCSPSFVLCAFRLAIRPWQCGQGRWQTAKERLTRGERERQRRTGEPDVAEAVAELVESASSPPGQRLAELALGTRCAPVAAGHRRFSWARRGIALAPPAKSTSP